MLETTTEEFNQEVCQHFNTSLQQIRKDVEVLKEWIRQQPHLPQSSSDKLLTGFLIGCKNSMERAKEKIDNYYTVRLTLPEYYTGRVFDDERTLPISKEIKFFSVPKLTPDGYYLHMLCLVNGDVDKFDLPVLIKRTLAYGDLIQDNYPFSKGHYLVVDCSLFTTSHLRWLTPTSARDMMYCLQDVYPVIVKGIILINSPSFVELVMRIVSPFMKKKLFQKIHIHTEGPEILEKYFPKRILPSDYGGEEETSEKLNDQLLAFLKEKRDWLATEGVVTVDEKKRVGSSPRNGLNSQEVHGSFKALCLD